MTNEPIFNVATTDHKQRLCSSQAAIETRLLPPAGIAIAKVLSFSAEANLNLTDILTGEARFSGKIHFRVLFLDTGGLSHSLETITEFSDKISSDAIISGAKPNIHSKILDTEIISVSHDEIKMAAVLEVDLFDNIGSRIKYLSGVGEDIFIREESASVFKLAASANETINLSNEVKVEGSRILQAESKIFILKTLAGEENISVEGEIISNILIEQDNDIIPHRAVTSFSHELSAAGCILNSFSNAYAKINKAETVLLTDGEDSAISLEFDLELSANSYIEEEIKLATDAFSILNELRINTNTIDVTKTKNMRSLFERIEGSVTLSNEMPLAERIVAIASDRLNLTNTYILDEKLIIEGTVTASIIYYSAETEGKNTIAIELPFSISTMEHINGEIAFSCGDTHEISAKLRRGNEIDIRAEICVNVINNEVAKIRVISELEIGDQALIPQAAISLHIARKDESLWDIAKAMRTTPELILLQNPGLELPLNGGERVMIYRHLKR
ncbi:MAG: DUF3794 domain-containing protein [Firmicutes bacterium]|nr:DUF3794 domain-containing protein [Bacillota bacterium]